ncbi:hypothetical protein FACS1894171_0140 [Clostridia bacterium]|nr:hypothetical protein FACS1894171_0140 [Clostridia bacterium]
MFPLIIMAGVDHSTAELRDREVFSFAAGATVKVMSAIAGKYDLSGIVIISTCNRTELYVSAETELDLPEAVCYAVGVDAATHRDRFYVMTERDALIHLCEVACGIKSRVFGEEQILTQVKESIDLARKENFADSMLETAFRLAITAAKKARTLAMPKTTKPSSAGRAVDMINEQLGDITGKRAVVIGSGEMGKLAATLLVGRGADVAITTRSYKTGEVRLPEGTRPVPYEDRLSAVDGADIVISATRSPHFTLTLDCLLELEKKPEMIVDLAMPRDIDPGIESVEGIRCVNIDEIGWDDSDDVDLTRVYEVFREHADRYYDWLSNKFAHIGGALKKGADKLPLRTSSN